MCVSREPSETVRAISDELMGERARGESETSRYLGRRELPRPDSTHPPVDAVNYVRVRVWGLTLTPLGPSLDAGPISYLILQQLP